MRLKCILFLLPLLALACTQKLSMEEASYEGRPHLLVKTSTLDYYYDVRGGGFSRILDNQGNDWVGFNMEPWGQYPASAASSFRGLPNLVFQGEDDGAGHPGHERCSSYKEGNRIYTESNSGKWKWCWEFHADHAVLEILRTDPDRSYWFLYEGTPGGSYQPGKSYFGSDQGGPFPGGYDYFRGDIGWGHYRWMYAGQEGAGGTFYMLQETADERMDMISFLGNSETGLDSPDGMTVFGFGREEGATPLLKGKQRFIIGLYPENIEDPEGHQKLSKYLKSKFLKQAGTNQLD
jgi:hypothetical protein